MKAFLMYKDQDFDLQRRLPANEQALIQDLALNTLFDAMALDDEFLLEVANKAVLSSLIQRRNPCPQGKVRVQWLCHLNDPSATYQG